METKYQAGRDLEMGFLADGNSSSENIHTIQKEWIVMSPIMIQVVI